MTTLCLTRDHLRVISGLARGHTLPRIGRDLHIAPITVRARIGAAARQVGITGGELQPQLVNYAYEHGYLDGLRPERRPPVSGLPPRLDDALYALTRGLSLIETAAAMGVAFSTAHTHRRRLYELLGAHTTGHAVALAWQQGLLARTPAHTLAVLGERS